MGDKVETIYPYDSKLKAGHIAALITLNTIASLFNIIINSFLSYAIIKLKLHRKISYRFILCLNISDLCVGAIVQPLLSARLAITDPKILPVLKIVLQFTGIVFCEISGVMTNVISLDRYLHMRHLQYYNAHMTPKKATILIIFSAVASILIGIALTVTTFNGTVIYVNTTVLSGNVLILFAIVVFYIRAYMSIKQRISTNQVRAARSNRKSSIQRPDLEFAKGMMFILVALFVCYVPYLVMGLLISLTRYFKNSAVSLGLELGFYWALLFLYFISSYNAFILMIFDRKLRAFTRGYFFGETERRESSNRRETSVRLEDIP
eukprot:Seg4381.1 transcript_id=Seg4381.1/GoldUCD/mRNA.D3Y31 product="hypothetical protein" protein_id=Seg4381.1/GoldUCD/D3Y31